jgi:hypothetical protein
MGESLASLGEGGPPPPGAAHIVPDADGFLWIAEDAFGESFCQDLDPVEGRILAAAQKPLAARCALQANRPRREAGGAAGPCGVGDRGTCRPSA